MTTVLVPLKRKGQTHIMKIDYDDWQKLKHIKWWVNNTTRNFYARNSKLGYLHNILLNTAKGHVADHINGNSLDNRRVNLRQVTIGQNSRNISVRKTSKTGYKGVSYHALAKKFMVQINFEGTYHYLGLYKTKEEAALVYNKAAIQLHGQYAKLNEVSLG